MNNAQKVWELIRQTINYPKHEKECIDNVWIFIDSDRHNHQSLLLVSDLSIKTGFDGSMLTLQESDAIIKEIGKLMKLPENMTSLEIRLNGSIPVELTAVFHPAIKERHDDPSEVS